MRLLTAGSLVRAQQGEPKKPNRSNDLFGFFYFLLLYSNLHPKVNSRAAVNCSKGKNMPPACFCPWRPPKQGVSRAVSDRDDHVSRRKGLWPLAVKVPTRGCATTRRCDYRAVSLDLSPYVKTNLRKDIFPNDIHTSVCTQKQKTRLQHAAAAFFVAFLINDRVVARKAAKRVFLYLNTDKNDAGIVCSKELPMGSRRDL